jgi:[acyl-carrier-protein] S-malonyltransferase
MAVTFLFPGQGSQKVGMASDLHQAHESVRARFAEANLALGRDLSGLCFNGPEDELKATQNTQPALFTVESAIVDVLAAKGVTPAFTAGHSLGEYSALYAAGVFSFGDGLALVARRGELMARAGQKKPGAMAAVIGLAVEKIREVLGGVSAGVVVPANQNTPEQTVISGEVAAVNQACELLKQAGAKKAILLPVSGAFHSPLMQEAADEFAIVLKTVQFRKPRCPVIANVTARPESDPAVLRELLVKQLVSPVRWVESMACLAQVAAGDAYEVGPGSVLKGLARSCTDRINVISCGTAENVYSIASIGAAT